MRVRFSLRLLFIGLSMVAVAFRGAIDDSAVKTILTSAPNCVIDNNETDLGRWGDATGRRYRLHQGEIEQTDYRESWLRSRLLK